MKNYFPLHRYIPVIPILGIVTSVTLQAQPIVAVESSEISAKIKNFTVQIDGEESGTGTIIEQNGNTYTVITCWHVVDSLTNYQVITSDGEKYRVTNIKNLPNVDLATFEFTSSNTYSFAQLGNSQVVTEGTNTYVAGYPDPFPGFPKRKYIFHNAGVVSRLEKAEAENGYQIIHDNPSPPGGSGGGIFAPNGTLIGINGRYISEGDTGKSYGVAIPLEIYLATRSDLKIPVETAARQNLVSMGVRKYKQEDYRGAITDFTEALTADANDLEAYYSRGSAFFALKDYQAAIADFNRFLQLSPNNHLVYFYRGYILAEAGDYQQAIADYSQSIQINSNFDLAYTNRGFAYARSGNVREAIFNYDRAIQLNPQSATAYYNRGLVYGRDLKDYQQALADFSQAIDLAPEDAQVYVDRGNVYSLLRDLRSAINDYSQAIKLNPQHAQVHYNRGIAYSQSNQPEKALVDLQRAATLFNTQGDTVNYQRALDRVKEIQGIQ